VVCGQGLSEGGVLSPLLWSLVVDELVQGLNENGYNTLGYAADIAILVSRKFPYTVSRASTGSFVYGATGV
jgi:hypothetical protein